MALLDAWDISDGIGSTEEELFINDVGIPRAIYGDEDMWILVHIIIGRRDHVHVIHSIADM